MEFQFQFDMWGVTPTDRWDWSGLKAEIRQHGVRNSLLLAPMPTASTSQILGNNECFEPYTSNIYSRRVLAGEFTIVNRQLLQDLMELGLWTPEIKNKIIAFSGSIQNIDEIPSPLKNLYKTVWEISQRTLINMASDRGAFIDQSQSFNVFMGEPTIPKLTSLHFYSWKKGLKTGMYYLRTRPAVDAIKFTIDPNTMKQVNSVKESANMAAASAQAPVPTEVPKVQEEKNTVTSVTEGDVCTMKEGCLMCGS